jgi:transposase
MDKIEYRAVIKFLVREGLTLNKIHSKFINIYGDPSRSFSTIKKWAAKFKRGRTTPTETCAAIQKAKVCWAKGKAEDK